MKLRKLKLLAMALSLFAACGGMLSAMETSENSKINSKSGQNKNKTENNKPQSNGKSNENSGLQIPHYVYPVGYLGLNEIGNLLGFDYLLFGRYGIIKGAKHLLFGESNKKVEAEKGPYWQYNLSVIQDNKTHNWPDKSEVIKVLERIMDYTNESFLLELTGITKLYVNQKSPNNKFGERVDSNFGDKKTAISLLGVETKKLTDEIKGNFGVSKGNSWVDKFFDNLRGNKKINKAGRVVCGVIYFKFDEDDFRYEVHFAQGGIFDYRTYCDDSPPTAPQDYRMNVKKIGETNEMEVRFRVPVWLYST